jgi:uncharacterized membrane protein YfcA
MPAATRQRAGRIINIASVSAMRGGGSLGNTIYGASKASVVALTMGLARELGPLGITVNAVAPAVADTAMTRAALTDDMRRRIVARIPLGRLAALSDIADLVSFRSRRLHHRGGDPGRRRHPHHLTRRMEMQHLLVVGVVMLAGFMRGITGFGGAALMAPLLSAMLGPVQAVVTALTLETAAALIMFPDAWPRFNRRVLLYLTIPACVTVPIGGYLLVNVDAFIMRKVIAGVVVAFALALFSGLRYSRPPRPATSLALGSIVGVLLGATSVGAPPVILYLLASSDSHTVIRANLTVFVTAISVIGLIMLSAIGAITVPVAADAGVAVIPFLIATWLGGKLFGKMNELVARRTALSLMLFMGVIGLLV